MSKPGEPMDLDDVFVKKTAPAFKVGDVVHLRSGGSMMTVGAVSDEVNCDWHDQSGQPQNYSYAPSQLVPYNEPKQDTEPPPTTPVSGDWRKQHGLA